MEQLWTTLLSFKECNNTKKSYDHLINPNLTVGWVGKMRKKTYLPKEEEREGGEKKRAQRARRARGSNPGPAAC